MEVAIVGGGIGGLTTAIGLHKIGIKAHIYEQAPYFKPLGTGIGIGSNAMLALNELGVAHDILKSGMPLHDQQFLNANGKVMNTIDFRLLKNKFGEENIAIERSDLHQALFDAINPEYIHFNKKMTHFNQTKTDVTIHFNDQTSVKADYVIAADGIHSIFRQTLLPNSTPRYAGYTCWRGIAKIQNDVESHISSEAWSKDGRFGWAPLYNGYAYWFACINISKNDEYFKSLDQAAVAKQFSHYPKLVNRLINDTPDEYFLHHDIYDIKPLNNFIFNRICLLGDAAHATTPNMGQGAGQSIEDAYELMIALQETASIKEAFKQYNKKRVDKTRKVINLSRQIGWAAQWDNQFLITFRDSLFPLIPNTLLFKRLTFLFK
ncbi:MAG TPA: FAD-dependent monooxygenase [Pseudogracilibacillus sp.]|nr:FAD-dependent monooxygenase [Pseudogracilibacillus sp.]